jgi:cobalt-zinc-cadmium efflux system outer membrane protein
MRSLGAAVCGALVGAFGGIVIHGQAPSPPTSPSEATAPAATLTLEQAVTRARAASPLARAADIRARSAASAAPLAGRLPNPTVEFSTENLQPGGRASSDPSLDTFLVLTQPIELGGKAGARRRAAEADAAVRSAGVGIATRDLTLDTASTYIGALRARARLALYAAQRESTREIVTVLGRRVAEGVAPEADLRKVEADLARLDLQAAHSDIDLQTSLAWLAALIASDGPIDAASLVVPAMAALEPDLAITGTSLTRSPDVTLARQQAASAGAALDLERRRRWPDLGVSGGYKRTAGVDTAVAGVTLAVPVFNRNDQAIALSLGDQLATEQLAADAERRARAEMSARIAAARLLVERAATLDRDVLAPAEIARRAARTSFQEGEGDVLRLLDAERVYGDAQRDASDVRLEAVLAVLRARIVLGEEWP